MRFKLVLQEACWSRGDGGQNGGAFGFALIFFATFLHQGKKVEDKKKRNGREDSAISLMPDSQTNTFFMKHLFANQ